MQRTRHDRAAQFAPFAALTGFEEVIKGRTVLRAPRRELLSDEIEEINRALASVTVGDTVRVTYFRDGAYVIAVGIVTDIDVIYSSITVVKNRIAFSDLYGIEKK